jgi:hypothetical protein
LEKVVNMIKYIAVLAVSLCACATATPPVPIVPPAPFAVVTPVPATFEVEGREKHMATAIPCTDDLDCAKKVTGFCANGFGGTVSLQAEHGRRVGIVVYCMSDEAAANVAAEEAEWAARRTAARAAEADRVQNKKPVGK